MQHIQSLTQAGKRVKNKTLTNVSPADNHIVIKALKLFPCLLHAINKSLQVQILSSLN